jgi:hypothetical protein
VKQVRDDRSFACQVTPRRRMRHGQQTGPPSVGQQRGILLETERPSHGYTCTAVMRDCCLSCGSCPSGYICMHEHHVPNKVRVRTDAASLQTAQRVKSSRKASRPGIGPARTNQPLRSPLPPPPHPLSHTPRHLFAVLRPAVLPPHPQRPASSALHPSAGPLPTQSEKK